MQSSPLEVFFVFLRLGLTSFGGPLAHLGYFHGEFVRKRKWLNDDAYSDLVALCQFLPGPASSQVGIAIGLSRAGIAGSIAAWAGFTIPSAVLMVAFAYSISAFHSLSSLGLLHGLKLVAVAVVAQALWGMARKLCPDIPRALIALLAAGTALLIPTPSGQVLVLLGGAGLGLLALRQPSAIPDDPATGGLSGRGGMISFLLLVGLLLLLPFLAASTEIYTLQMISSYFRVGSLAFGGGHVVLPLLETQVVERGWVSPDAFMAGYGAAQAIPGPLFTICAYLGALSKPSPHGVLGAAIALAAVFFPSFLLVFAATTGWQKARKVPRIRFAMLGINAAVVGILLAAFWNPVWKNAIFSPLDFGIAALFFVLLSVGRAPSWSVVIVGATMGYFWL